MNKNYFFSFLLASLFLATTCLAQDSQLPEKGTLLVPYNIVGCYAAELDQHEKTIVEDKVQLPLDQQLLLQFSATAGNPSDLGRYSPTPPDSSFSPFTLSNADEIDTSILEPIIINSTDANNQPPSEQYYYPHKTGLVTLKFVSTQTTPAWEENYGISWPENVQKVEVDVPVNITH
jgi:hypothetical protein